MFLLITKICGSDYRQATFVLQLKNQAKYFVPLPGAWLLHIGFKWGVINTQIGDSMLKYLGTESFNMAIEAEWYEAAEIMINQEEDSEERYL